MKILDMVHKLCTNDQIVNRSTSCHFANMYLYMFVFLNLSPSPFPRELGYLGGDADGFQRGATRRRGMTRQIRST
jgi:hypothetical protein